jgi:16S rRNA (cytosine1402-N4)-methyltransferase
LPQDAVLLDGTLGTGGHTLAMLRSHPTLRVVAFDRDAASIEVATGRLREAGLDSRLDVVRGDFRHAPRLLRAHLEKQASEVNDSFLKEVRVDGALIDAGMSLWQVLDPEHGLSFRLDAALDMRYDREQEWSAFDVVNRSLPQDLENLLFSYTDERWARRIVEFIVAARRRSPIRTTSELASLVEAAIPVGVRRQSRVHPATKTFAALRLAVNTEFWALDEGVRALCSVLSVSSRLVVLTYSSHEDRIIKHLFRRLAGRSDAASITPTSDRKNRTTEASSERFQPPGHARPPLTSFSNFSKADRESLPPGLHSLEPEVLALLRLPEEDDARDDEAEDALIQSGWGRSWTAEIVTRKPVEPTEEEVALNPLARSCKLRAIEKRALE